MNSWKNSRKYIAAFVLVTMLTACGGTPPPLPPPPPQNPNGGFYGGGGGVGCVQATGVLPLNSTNLLYTGNLVDSYNYGSSSSISTTLYYQQAPNAGLTIQNIVGTAQLTLPQLSQFTGTYQTTSQFCVSTTDPTTGASRPGRMYNGAVQLVMTGQIPVSMAGYLPQYTNPQSVPAVNQPMEVRIGYSCDAWVGAEGRLYGCVDVVVQNLGVYLSLYSQ